MPSVCMCMGVRGVRTRYVVHQVPIYSTCICVRAYVKHKIDVFLPQAIASWIYRRLNMLYWEIYHMQRSYLSSIVGIKFTQLIDSFKSFLHDSISPLLPFPGTLR